MKKLLILFGLNNLVIAWLLARPLLTGEERLDFTLPSIFLCSVIILFIITAVGLPLRNQFAWSANIILSALVVIIVLSVFFLFLSRGIFNVPTDLILGLSIRLLGFFIVMGIAIFSIIRTLRQDTMQLLQITLTQKWLTAVAGLLVAAWMGWSFVHFTSLLETFE